MIAPINPTGPSTPSGNAPDVSSVAKPFETELSSLIAVLHNLNTSTLDPQLNNVAAHIIAAHQLAQSALSLGKS